MCGEYVWRGGGVEGRGGSVMVGRVWRGRVWRCGLLWGVESHSTFLAKVLSNKVCGRACPRFT